MNRRLIRTAWRKYWTFMLGFSTLVLGGLIAVSAEFGGGLSHLQTDKPPITVFYWASRFCETVALPLTGLLLLITVMLIVVTIIQLIQERPEKAIATAFGVFLASMAIVLAVFSVLPNLLVGYTHLDGIEFNGHRYNLGVKGAIDGDFSYIVGTCDRLGIRCTCCAVSSAASYGWQNAKFERDPELNMLTIKSNDGTIDFQDFNCDKKK